MKEFDRNKDGGDGGMEGWKGMKLTLNSSVSDMKRDGHSFCSKFRNPRQFRFHNENLPGETKGSLA